MFLILFTRSSLSCFLLRTELTEVLNHSHPLCVLIPHWFSFLLILLYPNPSSFINRIKEYIMYCLVLYPLSYIKELVWNWILNSTNGIVVVKYVPSKFNPSLLSDSLWHPISWLISYEFNNLFSCNFCNTSNTSWFINFLKKERYFFT